MTCQFEKTPLKSKPMVVTYATKVFVRDGIATRQLFLDSFLWDLCAIEIYVAIFFFSFAFPDAEVNIVPLFIG